MAQAAVLITYREILKREPTRNDLHNILKKYKRREFVTLLGQLNCLLGTWQNAPNFDVDGQLSALLLQKHNYEIESLRASTERRVVFSRLALLYLVKQSCIACPDDGLLVQTEEARNEVGLCCLLANDLLLPFAPSPADGTIKKIANILPFADYISHDQYPYEIGRTLIMFTGVAQEAALQKRTDFLDICSLFETNVGLPVEIFCQLVFGCATKFLNVDLKQLESSTETLFLKSTFLGKTSIDPKMVEVFFGIVAISDQALKAQILQATNRPDNDLTIFQAHPILKIADDVYVCLDPGFLVDKAGRGAFWTLFGAIADHKLRIQLLNFWGILFEAYVNQILEQTYRVGRQIDSPRFPNGDEAFDACLLEDGDIIAFEFKSSTLRADAKYGGDPQRLKDELHLKFIEGKEEKSKGIAQLYRSIERFLSGEDIGEISGSRVSKIYSALVCLDNTVGIPYVGHYFNQHFDGYSLRRMSSKRVTPVFTLSISDLENMLGYLDRFRLGDILESYYRNNKSMLTAISRSSVPLLSNAKSGKNPVRERFLEFGRNMEKNLFGVKQASASVQPEESPQRKY
jgi:hypothetical protein